MLAQIPAKFKKLIWIKRGNFLIVRRPSELMEASDKVKAIVEHVLFPDHIKAIQQEGLWPSEFEVESPKEPEQVDFLPSSDEENDEVFINPNRRYLEEEISEEEENDEEDE
jgi:probable RNA-binding protein EIF1AD